MLARIRILLLLCCLMPATRAYEQIISQSGQIVIHGKPLPYAANYPFSNGAIQLQPELLAVSAERIKQALLRQLNLADRYERKIHFLFPPQASKASGITVVSVRNLDGWQFELALPSQVEPLILIRGIVQALLQEIAQRSGGPRQAEIPAWLVEGLSLELLAANGSQFILHPESHLDWMVKYDPLFEARNYFKTNSALSFTELSLPSAAQLSKTNSKAFQYSAQLFTHELLSMQKGQAAMVGFLSRLSYCWNWQTAFFQTYSPVFTRMIDVEKWWTLALLQFGRGEKGEDLTGSKGFARLEEILRAPASLRFYTNQVPATRIFTLQEVLRQWNEADQAAILPAKITDLKLARYVLNAPMATVALEYAAVLADYLDRRAQLHYVPSLNIQPETRLELLVGETIKKLDQLDLRLARLRNGQSGQSLAKAPIR